VRRLLAQSRGERYGPSVGPRRRQHPGWKSVLRCLNVLLMEELLPSPAWQDSAGRRWDRCAVWPTALISRR
jgi:hypothetical protein